MVRALWGKVRLAEEDKDGEEGSGRDRAGIVCVPVVGKKWFIRRGCLVPT